ncbi:response regulator transcription factor [Actinocatenispora thailandica]
MFAGIRWRHTVYPVASGEGVLDRLTEHPTDAVLVDCATVRPGCVPLVRHILHRSPRTAVVVVGADSPQLVAAVLAAGARGVVGGGRHGVRLAVALAHGLRSVRPDGTAPAGPGCALTDRELAVLRGMSHGRTNAEIGRDLHIAEDTVKTHARRLYRKLGARDRAHAVAQAFRAGLVT